MHLRTRKKTKKQKKGGGGATRATNLVERVLDGHDRVLRGEILVQLAELFPGKLLGAALVLEV